MNTNNVNIVANNSIPKKTQQNTCKETIKETFKIKGGTKCGQFKCGYCENTFEIESKMNKHIKATFQIVEQMWPIQMWALWKQV